MIEKTCGNCIHCECCPCLPPCLDWEECLQENYKMFEPTLFCKIINFFKKHLTNR